MLDIYAASEKAIEGVTAEALVERMRQFGHRGVEYAGGGDAGVEPIVRGVAPGDMIETLGAGSVSQLGDRILEKLPMRASSRIPSGPGRCQRRRPTPGVAPHTSVLRVCRMMGRALHLEADLCSANVGIYDRQYVADSPFQNAVRISDQMYVRVLAHVNLRHVVLPHIANNPDPRHVGDRERVRCRQRLEDDANGSPPICWHGANMLAVGMLRVVRHKSSKNRC